MAKIRFIATGDYLQTRRVPPNDTDFKRVQSVISVADAAVTNLEMTLSYKEGVPNGYSGGTHLYTPPDRLEDLQAYGFNLVACANNHCLDYGETGLAITMEYLRDYGVNYAGIGMNRGEAAKPAYLDTTAGRVALLSVASSIVKPWYPETAREDMPGRPGANALKCFNDLRVTKEQFAVLQQIRESTHFNNLVDLMITQGFVNLPEGYLPFGFDIYCFPLLFRLVREGEKPGLTTHPDPTYMKRLVNDVQSAKLAADYVVVNLHGHEMKGPDIETPPDFHITAAHGWIDAGADAVVIQGCHQLRGVEIYKGKPVFYSLGNFVFQDSTLEAVPQVFYDEHAQNPEETFNQITARLAQNPEYIASNPQAMTSVFAGWKMEDGRLTALTLYPIDLHAERPLADNGFPSLSDQEEILDRMIRLSRPFGTEIAKETETLPDGTQQLVGRIRLEG